MPAQSAADVRAALRGARLRVLRVTPVRLRSVPERLPLHSVWSGWLRSCRRPAKAELFESLATMLDAGVSIVEALETVAAERANAASRTGTGVARPAGFHASPGARLADRLRDAIRSGHGLADAMIGEPAWFDAAEVAMARAGEHRGEMAPVLRSLAERHHRSGEVASRLVTALAYPAIVGVVGLGVVVFLSTGTLPQLVGVLRESGVAPPPLTLWVMAFGRAIVSGWLWVCLGAPLAVLGGAGALKVAARRGAMAPAWARRLLPATLREAGLAAANLDLSDLLRVGVPLTEALRVVAPSFAGPMTRGLSCRLVESAGRIERGEMFSSTLDDPHWFDAEIVRLVSIGESAGELHTMLRQVGQARARRARRTVDRLAGMLEPVVIIVLAALVGVVVMSAVLPMLRLQEVI
jgi:type II secretory pathway component PulF